MLNVDETRVNILIPKKKNRYDSICISDTNSGKRCKNKREGEYYCYTHRGKSVLLYNLIGPEEDEATVKELHGRYLAKHGTSALIDRIAVLDKLLKDDPIEEDKSGAFQWTPQSFDWVKCEQCMTHSLLQAGGCKTCKLFDRLLELPKNS